MGTLLICGLSPHPPLLIPDIGGDNIKGVEKTRDAMEKFSKAIKEADPDTLIFITPHGPIFKDAISLLGEKTLSGDFRRFRAPRVKLAFENDLELLALIEEKAREAFIPTITLTHDAGGRYGVSAELDHGTMVPLYYLDKVGLHPSLVTIGFGLLPFEELYSFGRALRSAIEASGKKVAIIASGDLSHKLTPDAPYGYEPMGQVFDERLMELLKKMDVKGIMNLDKDLIEKAAECGLRSIIIMLGALHGLKVSPEILSYEGPFGVGYGVALLKINAESSLVRLARETVEEYVRNGRVISRPKTLEPEMIGPAGVFVSIKKDGQLRGCIGTIGPTQPSIAEEIISNTISASTRDPRFLPVREEELESLVYSVDVLTEPEAISRLSELDPKRYGVIVSKGNRRGLLLPNLEGVDSVEEQVMIAKRKAGIDINDHDVALERFEVIRWT